MEYRRTEGVPRQHECLITTVDPINLSVMPISTDPLQLYCSFRVFTNGIFFFNASRH